MQLSARILTALAVLAFTVAVVAGRGATEEVSAATGTIDAIERWCVHDHQRGCPGYQRLQRVRCGWRCGRKRRR